MRRLLILLLFIAPSLCANQYTTNFPTSEPGPVGISQNGNWVGGQTAGGNLWGSCQSSAGVPGLLFGISMPTQFGDPSCILTGSWGANQLVHGVASVLTNFTGNCCHEIALRARVTISANSITGYESYCSIMSNNQYCSIARWNGPNGSYWNLCGTNQALDANCTFSAPTTYVVNGDNLVMTVTGTNPTTITLYKNGVHILTAVDTGSAGGGFGAFGPWTTGTPGASFYDQQDGSWNQWGWTDFDATDNFQVASTYTTSCLPADFQTAFNNANTNGDGTWLYFPQSNCAWAPTSTVNLNQTHSVVLLGSGSVYGGNCDTVQCLSNSSPTLGTVITDNAAFQQAFMLFATATGKSFRITGFTMKGGTGQGKNNGVWATGGTSQAVRLDHNYFDTSTYSPGNNAVVNRISGWVYGVGDHNLFNAPLTTNESFQVWMDGYGGKANGDGGWNDTDGLGSNRFFFAENNTVHTKIFNDCDFDGRMVIRYNYFDNSTTQTHPTGSSGRSRGCRAQEVYKNTMVGSINCKNNVAPTSLWCNSNAHFWSSGVGVYWGNLNPSPATTSYESLISLHNMRAENQTYPQTPYPNGWGYSGRFWAGTLTADGSNNVVAASASQTTAPFGFTVQSISNGGPINLGPSTLCPSCTNEHINIAGVDYIVTAWTDNQHVTVNNPVPAGSGLAFYVPESPWDQNAVPSTGYHALDQPGMGDRSPGVAPDLLSGSFPNVVNVTQGNIVAWPREGISGVYEWLNDWYSMLPAYGGSVISVFDFASFTANVDYFQNSSNTSSAGTSANCNGFTGVSGVGCGPGTPIAGAYTGAPTCTNGVGWFNTSSQTLYKCGLSVSGQWAAYYTPYTYPHPSENTFTPSGTQVATPTFSPIAGTYPSAQAVAMSSTTPGATICYAINATPTANGAGVCGVGSTTYVSQIMVSANETINAIGSKSGLSDSFVGSAVYNIGGTSKVGACAETQTTTPNVTAQAQHNANTTETLTTNATLSAQKPGTSIICITLH